MATLDVVAERDLYRRLFDVVPFAVCVIAPDGSRLVSNRAYEEIAPRIADRGRDAAVLASGIPTFEEQEHFVDGADVHPLSVSRIPLRDDAGAVSGLLWVAQDRSAREQALRDNLELQEFLTSIVENIPNMIFVKDAEELRFVRFNRAGEALLGFPREELIGKNDFDFFPEDEARWFIEKDRATLRSGKVLDIPAEPIQTKNGLRILHTKKLPIVHDGKARYLLGISEDITDRVESERQLREQNAKLEELARQQHEAHEALKRAQSQMLQADKLAALGQLVAGVAHEINNPLSFVNNNVAVLEREMHAMSQILDLHEQAAAGATGRDPKIDDAIAKLSERIDLPYIQANIGGIISRTREGLRRIQQIVGDLRDFARLDESERQDVDINEGIRSTVNIIRGLAKTRGVDLTVDLAELPPLQCHPAKLNQVFLNLIANAIDACASGQRVEVRSCANDGFIMIEVRDDGSGIAPDVLPRIFDPFFTTKPQGQGTGLGLAISYGIVRDHGGAIDVTSSVGGGSLFVVKLPRTDGRAVRAPAAADADRTASPDSPPHRR